MRKWKNEKGEGPFRRTKKEKRKQERRDNIWNVAVRLRKPIKKCYMYGRTYTQNPICIFMYNQLKLSFCRWVLLSHDTHPTIESFLSVWPATNLTNTQNSKPIGDTLGRVMQIVGHSYFSNTLFFSFYQTVNLYKSLLLFFFLQDRNSILT